MQLFEPDHTNLHTQNHAVIVCCLACRSCTALIRSSERLKRTSPPYILPFVTCSLPYHNHSYQADHHMTSTRQAARIKPSVLKMHSTCLSWSFSHQHYSLALTLHSCYHSWTEVHCHHRQSLWNVWMHSLEIYGVVSPNIQAAYTPTCAVQSC